MQEAMEKTLRRVREDAEHIIATHSSAKQALDSLVMEFAPAVIMYKTRGVAPNMQTLSYAAAKMVAIVAATHYDHARNQEANSYALPISGGSGGNAPAPAAK